METAENLPFGSFFRTFGAVEVKFVPADSAPELLVCTSFFERIGELVTNVAPTAAVFAFLGRPGVFFEILAMLGTDFGPRAEAAFAFFVLLRVIGGMMVGHRRKLTCSDEFFFLGTIPKRHTVRDTPRSGNNVIYTQFIAWRRPCARFPIYGVSK